MKISKDKKKIKELLTRGVENVYPSQEWLEKELTSGRRLKVYLGIDPTAPTLHIGHAAILMKLKAFQELGHEVVLLIGSFTGMIGDPTGKLSARKQLTREEVLNNAKKYKKQAGVFLNFSGAKAAMIVFNHKWLDKLTLRNLAEIGMNVTARRLMERDMFQERDKEGKPIYFTELMYPLLQGYDSVAMKVDGEVGGNDQTFNMLMGRDLMGKMLNKEKFVLTTKLLTDPTGKKMGKTEGNMITLEDTAQNMFGKVMSWPDEMVANGFELCTAAPMEKVEAIEGRLKKENPRDIKMELAEEMVSIYHGKAAAKKAKEEWKKTFSRKETPEKMEEIKLDKTQRDLVWLVVKVQQTSKSDAWRLIKQGGVRVNGKKGDIHTQLTGGEIVKIGKKKFVRIK